ncbi:MAG: hypothetical protein IKK82_13220 [Kiritimatiellae bacterium]|nr:hypothetical protein [Kiritimatiellia bacterium]
MFDPYRKRREKAAHIREMRMGAVDFSLPVDGDVPSLRRPSSQAGDFMDSLVEDLTRERSAFFDDVVRRWREFFPDVNACPGKWVSDATPKSGGRLFLHVASASALFALRPKLPSIKKKLATLASAPVRFTLHLEIAHKGK